MEFSCNHVIQITSAEFSSRRSMLGALIYLNPDSGERSTSWINPILADCADRRAWESAFFSLKQEGIASQNTILFFANTNLDNKGTSATENDKIQYWWKFILEGLQMGQKIRDIVESRKEEECLNV